MRKYFKPKVQEMVSDLLPHAPLSLRGIVFGINNVAPCPKLWSVASDEDIAQTKHAMHARAMGLSQFRNLDPRLAVGLLAALTAGLVAMYNPETTVGTIGQYLNWLLAAGCFVYATNLFSRQGAISAREIHLAWALLKPVPPSGRLARGMDKLLARSELCRTYRDKVLQHRKTLIAVDLVVMRQLAIQEPKSSTLRLQPQDIDRIQSMQPA